MIRATLSRINPRTGVVGDSLELLTTVLMLLGLTRRLSSRIPHRRLQHQLADHALRSCLMPLVGGVSRASECLIELIAASTTYAQADYVRLAAKQRDKRPMPPTSPGGLTAHPAVAYRLCA